ncbi:NAD(P)H-dependent glycerol-3-phosphate dehydrogenase [Accumulibacter sp.]|uniref:NAD(P)H-dependent glycerol-3-phosphate dehydrogenase n=1 Tax=Accumulibacter sp. TaxID=2053492 RepID=UPI0035B4C0F2
MKLTVLGAGAWGSALAAAFCDRHTVTLWAREPEVLRALRDTRENPRYLPGRRLPEALRIGDDFATAVADADLLLIATPLAGLRPTLGRLRDAAVASPLVWACKGLEAETGKLPHQIVAEELGAQRLCAALSGPSFADEVARGLPTAVTLAANDAGFGQQTALALHSPRFRVYANDDLPGVEVGGAVKNIMAIATGVCDGLGLGLNARAALITRGLAEIARFGVALGGQAQTFMGLAGIGDLILTCTGELSRNRRVGLELAAGKTLSQILRDLGHVAEGVSTTREVARLASQLAIEMPITQAVDAILYRAEPAASAVEKLLSRDPKSEGA